MQNGHLWTAITPKQAIQSLSKFGHLLKWTSKKAHVMDLGCGEGYVTSKILYPFIKDHIDNITAVDISQDLIDYAKKEYKMKNINYQVMDAMNAKQIDEMKGKFSHIFSFYVAQWIPDQRSFSDGLRKMLKPDGQIFVTHVSRTPLHDSYHRHFREGSWINYLPEGTGLQYYTENPAGYIRKILEDVGFKVEVCQHEHVTEHLEHCPDFIRALISLHPYLERIPPKLREDYYQDHLKYALAKCTYLKEPDVYVWSYETLTCVASI